MTPGALLRAALVGVLLAGESPASAAQINVAVAANFADAAKEIAAAFKARTGHTAVLSFGSSAQLLAQIAQDAPFQVFLSADEERPAKAVDDQLAVAESRFTYAVGKIVLWSPDPKRVQGEATLREGRFARLSIANPAAAPYGAAAVEVLKGLGVLDAVQTRIVQGASIAQAFQFIETGNAELGFVALAQLTGRSDGSRWVVPQSLYRPIRQDAVLIAKAKDDEAARAFLRFLRDPAARAVIERFGYDVPAP